MKNYPQNLTEEQLDNLAKIFPDTAADLRCWKHALDLGDIYNFIIKTVNKEYE